MIKFEEKAHKYYDDSGVWTSATSLIARYKPKFNADEAALKASKNRKSKWFNYDPEYIKSIWNQERDRATTLGSSYHAQREQDLLACTTISVDGSAISIHPCKFDDNGHKEASSQILGPGVYPEHLIYLKSHKIAGQSDVVEVVNGKVNIIDFKTNKEIKTESYRDWKGVSQKMYAPVAHLDDCNYNHYALQLSLYMYMILKHNPKLKPGDLILKHIVFKKQDEDKFGYPIYELDNNGDPIVESVVIYKVPYLKKEITEILKDYGKNI